MLHYGAEEKKAPTVPIKPEIKSTPVSIESKPKARSVVGQYGSSYGARPEQKKPEEAAPDTQKEINRIVSLVREGATVKHKSFGQGTVTNIDKAQKHIRVKFSVGEKTFLFPDAFLKGFLSV